MNDLNFIEKKLKGMLSPNRWEHSVNVKNEAVKLAIKLGVDVHKAAVAGILHDCARDMSYQQLLNKAEEFDIIIDNATLHSPSIIHALIGPEIARREFGVSDEDVLNAMRYHTTGRGNMSLLEKIVFIADAVEPSRNYPGVKRIREVLIKSLDDAVLAALENTINHLVSKRQLIHVNTLRARNHLLLNERETG